MVIGAQLYTVRDFTKNLNDFSETLKKISDMGYKAVQISCTCPFEPEWLKNELSKNGLVAPIRHYSFDDITKYTDKIVPEDLSYGCTQIGLGYYTFKEWSYEAFEEKVVPLAKRIKELGGKFAYHNHDSEFMERDGKIIFDRILELLPPELMDSILDVYWVQRGGGDPIYWLHKLEGRTRSIHLKDMKYEQKMAVVGDGNMNFDGILKAACDTNVKYAFVEQDDCYGENPFDCLEKSLAYLRSRGLNE